MSRTPTRKSLTLRAYIFSYPVPYWLKRKCEVLEKKAEVSSLNPISSTIYLHVSAASSVKKIRTDKELGNSAENDKKSKKHYQHYERHHGHPDSPLESELFLVDDENGDCEGSPRHPNKDILRSPATEPVPTLT